MCTAVTEKLTFDLNSSFVAPNTPFFPVIAPLPLSNEGIKCLKKKKTSVLRPTTKLNFLISV